MEELDLWERPSGRDEIVPQPHSRDLRKHRFVLPNQAYSVTTIVQNRRPLLGARERDLVVSALEWLSRQGRVVVYAFAVMPDHLHAILAPLPPRLLPGVMLSLKGFVAREILRLRSEHGPFWQEGYFERAIRGPRDAWDARRYIEANPVRAGIVIRPEDFRWSSANPSFSSWIAGIQ